MPLKVKAFLWHCLRGILPSKLNLKRKSVVIDVICNVYDREENDFHALSGCSFALKCWLNFGFEHGSILFSNLFEFVHYLLQLSDDTKNHAVYSIVVVVLL